VEACKPWTWHLFTISRLYCDALVSCLKSGLW
jgi:hypothetical protein